MYKHKSKPDLLFLLTVFVCLGVLVTATVQSEEKKTWGITVTAESGCQQAVGEWQGCSKWYEQAGQKRPQRAALRLSVEDRPDLGVVWYYTQSDQALANLEVQLSGEDKGIASFGETYRGQFGVAFKRQYRNFGLSVGIEAEQPGDLTREPLLYFGINNRW